MLEVTIPLEPWPALRLKSKAEIDDIPDQIHDLWQRHLCEGSFSPTASILSQLAMGKKFNKLHLSPSNIHWSDDEQTIFYDGKGIALDKFQNMCHLLIQELRAEIKELAFKLNFPSLIWRRLLTACHGARDSTTRVTLLLSMPLIKS